MVPRARQDALAGKYPALRADADEILRLSEAYTAEFARNYQKWDLLGKKLLFHQHDSVCDYTSQYDAAQFLSDWLKARLEWLNQEWSGNAAARETDLTDLNFLQGDIPGVLGMYNCCTGVPAESGYPLRLRILRIPISRSCIPKAKNSSPQGTIAISKSPVWRPYKIRCGNIPQNSFWLQEKRMPRRRANPYSFLFRRMANFTPSCWISGRQDSGAAQSI